MDYLINLSPPARCLIDGDINIQHDAFEPEAVNLHRGGELVQWASEHGMDFVREIDVPTHAADHMIDLIFFNVIFTSTTLKQSVSQLNKDEPQPSDEQQTAEERTESSPLIRQRPRSISSRTHSYTTAASGSATSHDIVSPQYEEVLLRQSAMNLIAAFTHEVEAAFTQNKEVSMITMNVQSAFDAVLCRQLLQ
ncbi:predicted protein [Histoplasma mississippiense (nom. inval.)]|uniref:predicted protein n=1 Tax=Ajellomyces capsulatus (strain NAm1 / WU24) TaxID=2059318 RepID=UPI000157BB9F|nr:predicted protein [Histoplasma mississippiense (nom. inval.)]EDN04224.1 predicted protein [Histoplasma mississippiense (nom. inval.)]